MAGDLKPKRGAKQPSSKSRRESEKMAELRDAILASDEIDNAEDGARDAQEQHKKALRILKESQENKTQTTRSITD